MLHVPNADCFNAKTVRHSMMHGNSKNVIILHLKSKHDPTERKQKQKQKLRKCLKERKEFSINIML